MPVTFPGITYVDNINNEIYLQYEESLENGLKPIEISVTDEYGYVTSITKNIGFNKVPIEPATWDETNSYSTIVNNDEHKLVLAWNVNEWGWDDPTKISIDMVNLGTIDMEDVDGNYDTNTSTYEIFNERNVTSIAAESSLFDITSTRVKFNSATNEIYSTAQSHALTYDYYSLPLLVECDLKRYGGDVTILLGNEVKTNSVNMKTTSDYIVWGTSSGNANYSVAVNGVSMSTVNDPLLSTTVYTKFSVFVSHDTIVMYQNDMEKYRFDRRNSSCRCLELEYCLLPQFKNNRNPKPNKYGRNNII
jgi:hypothetical protein